MFKPLNDSLRSEAVHQIANCMNVKWNVKMTRVAAICRALLATLSSRYNLIISFGFWSVIYQCKGHWDYSGKRHFRHSYTSQIVSNERTMCVPQKYNIDNSKNVFFFSLCLHFILISYQRVLKRFLVPEAFWYATFLFMYKHTGFVFCFFYSHLICIFCHIICQSASRKKREVSLISSASYCCQLQSTPWWYNEENNPKFSLLIYWDWQARSGASVPSQSLMSEKSVNQGKKIKN